MNVEQKAVEEFHQKFRLPVLMTPTVQSPGELLFRSRLILEESTEFLTAASRRDLVEMVDALCDILYVVYGTAVVLGVDLQPIFHMIHQSNMTKEGVKERGGKVMKGDSWAPPKIMEELERQWVEAQEGDG